MALTSEQLRKAWKTLGWDKQFPEAFKAIGTPEFKEILAKGADKKSVNAERGKGYDCY